MEEKVVVEMGCLVEKEEEMERRMAVEFGEGVVEFGWTKEARGGALSLGGFSLGCRKQRRRREVNEERERRRGGIYRIWIVK